MQFDWRTRALQRASEFAFTLALVIFSALAYTLRRISSVIRDARAETWPMANARVTTGEVSAFHGQYFEHALGKIGYSYVVNGDYYSGYFVRQYRNEQRAWEFVDKLKDREVLVRYQADRPTKSILRASDQVGEF